MLALLQSTPHSAEKGWRHKVMPERMEQAAAAKGLKTLDGKQLRPFLPNKGPMGLTESEA